MKYVVGSWDLSPIAPGSLEKFFKSVEKQIRLIEVRRKFLTNSISPSQFMSILKEIEKYRIEAEKLACFVQLRFSENSADQKAVAELSKVETFLTKMSNRLIFFSLWFKKLPEKKALKLIEYSGKYRYFFEKIRKTKKFSLKEEEEKIVNIKDVTGVSALNSIYNIFTSQFSYDFEGKRVTQNELIKAVRDTSPVRRKNAYRSLFTKYQDNKDVIGEIYKNILNDWREENIGLRGHVSPISVRNVINDVPDKAIESLLKVCEENQKIFHKFFEIKRKKLGLKKLRRFDIYAPIRGKEGKMSYDKAVHTVLETFEGFSPRFKEEALRIISSKHVHSKPQKNKHTGAYCCSVTASLPPYVLLSYTGTLRDVSTLAHELGHGIHHNLAKDQTEFTNHSCLPLAETASIFSEMLLSEKLLEDDPSKAKEMIFSKLDDLYASITRQAGFVMFEIKAHQMMQEGKTIEEMSQVYLQDLQKQLGPVDVDAMFAYEWAYIPHIFQSPFYCYAYAFGNLLTLALYELYKEKGDAFASKIIDMLSAGGSMSPVEITKIVGVDITSEKFWQKGFDVIQDMIDSIDE